MDGLDILVEDYVKEYQNLLKGIVDNIILTNLID